MWIVSRKSALWGQGNHYGGNPIAKKEKEVAGMAPKRSVILRDRRREFHVFAMGVPFEKSGGITREEKIYIVHQVGGNWLFDPTATFSFDLLLKAINVVMELLPDPDNAFFGRGISKLLLRDPDDVKLYAARRKLSKEDAARLLRWAKWSKSPERKCIEAYFRRMWLRR